MKTLYNIRYQIFSLVVLLFLFLNIYTCKYDKGVPDYNGYPKEIGEILINKCSSAGCHNSSSAEACGGLDLSSWDKLFKGTRNNSSVIPYRPEHSFLLYSVNTFSDFGPQLTPTMPFNKPSLSKEDVALIQDWIAKGAPDVYGNVKWSDDPSRSKIYVVNQGCDYITVFDADSKLIMRSIIVGNTGSTESPHDMLVSPDGENLYVSFYASSIFQKIRTSDGQKVGEIDFTDLSWHSMAISGDSHYALTTHLDSDGKVALVDLTTMNVIIKYQGSGLFVYPHGCTMSYSGNLAYITSQQGNFIYKVDLTDPFSATIDQIPLETGTIPSTMGVYKPYEVEFSPDYSKYYVTCQGTNELRVFQSSNDSLLKTIPTTGVPQLISFSEVLPYAFVTCMEDSANVSTQSSVDIINTFTDQFVSSVQTGFQPRGVVVDDANKCVWVGNRNIAGVGWAPHHTTACAGRNGYMTIIDMNTLQLIPGWKTEVSVDPYSMSMRK